ncbi:hypothetical protein HDU92_008624 [Lobulomyces angularis]|nr:hypothetical protein HDU92_008624 [Lobulomyces angularis]
MLKLDKFDSKVSLKSIFSKSSKNNDHMNTSLKTTTFTQIPEKKPKFYQKSAITRKLNLNFNTFQINVKKLKKIEKLVDIFLIKEIRLGQCTSGFQNFGIKPENEDKAFSIVHYDGQKIDILNFLANSKEERDKFLSILNLYRQHSFDFEYYLFGAWVYVNNQNDNRDSFLMLHEVVDVFKYLNLKITVRELLEDLKKIGLENQKQINFEQFKQVFEKKSFNSSLHDIFNSYSSDKVKLTLEEFTNFVIEVQENNWTAEYCLDIFNKYLTDDDEQKMDYHCFTKFLFSEDNSIFLLSKEVVQDMTLPLQNYFMNSSHNTYLLEDQLKGNSSIEGYIRVLLNGCRCLEIDCWDGSEGEPIVYHGMTLTTKILFADVIKVIKTYAFVASPYPVILSLETHCTIEQQKKMAKYLISILKEELIVNHLKEDELNFPSPEDLKFKFLLKGKGIMKKDQNGNLTESFNSGEELNCVNDTVDNSKVTQSSSANKISEELAKLMIYFQSVKFSNFEDNMKYKFNQMCSIGESKSVMLSKTQREQYFKHNQKFFTRVYPKGVRVDSSNYNPITHWNSGCQMVALNHQTYDKGMQINQAMFMDNGRSGYILKPVKSDIPLKPVTITVTIISAHNLPKSKGNVKEEVMDPFIEVELFGEESEEKRDSDDMNVRLRGIEEEEEDLQFKFKTKYINNNGLNAVFNETFKFKLKNNNNLNHNFLRFKIIDTENLKNDFIACCCLHLSTLGKGYRNAVLYDWKGELLLVSKLLLHIDVEEDIKPNNSVPENSVDVKQVESKTDSRVEEVPNLSNAVFDEKENLVEPGLTKTATKEPNVVKAEAETLNSTIENFGNTDRSLQEDAEVKKDVNVKATGVKGTEVSTIVSNSGSDEKKKDSIDNSGSDEKKKDSIDDNEKNKSGEVEIVKGIEEGSKKFDTETPKSRPVYERTNKFISNFNTEPAPIVDSKVALNVETIPLEN